MIHLVNLFEEIQYTNFQMHFVFPNFIFRVMVCYVQCICIYNLLLNHYQNQQFSLYTFIFLFILLQQSIYEVNNWSKRFEINRFKEVIEIECIKLNNFQMAIITVPHKKEIPSQTSHCQLYHYLVVVIMVSFKLQHTIIEQIQSSNGLTGHLISRKPATVDYLLEVVSSLQDDDNPLQTQNRGKASISFLIQNHIQLLFHKVFNRKKRKFTFI